MVDSLVNTYCKTVCWEEDKSDAGGAAGTVSSRKTPSNSSNVICNIERKELENKMFWNRGKRYVYSANQKTSQKIK